MSNTPPASDLGALCEHLRRPAAQLVAAGQGRAHLKVTATAVLALVDGYTAQVARLAAVDDLKAIHPLSHGSDASGAVPCFDRYDYDAMRGVSYVILRESDWKRIQAAILAAGAVGAEGST